MSSLGMSQGGGSTGGAGNIMQGIMSLLSTGLGTYSQIRSGRETSKQRERLLNLSRAPLDIAGIYKPMSEAERKAHERQIHAELVVRGVPRDSAYATALASEIMAKTESQRYEAATKAALGQRSEEIRAMMGMPGYPEGGDTGAFGGFLGLQQILKALKQFQGGQQPTQTRGAKLKDPGEILFNPKGFSESLYGPDQWEEALGGPLTLGG